MSASSKARIVAVVIVLAAFAAACGQKPGVHVGFTGSGAAPVGADGEPLALNSEGQPIAGGAPVDSDGDGVADTSVAGGTGSTGTGGTGGTGSTGGTTTTTGGGGGGS